MKQCHKYERRVEFAVHGCAFVRLPVQISPGDAQDEGFWKRYRVDYRCVYKSQVTLQVQNVFKIALSLFKAEQNHNIMIFKIPSGNKYVIRTIPKLN